MEISRTLRNVLSNFFNLNYNRRDSSVDPNIANPMKNSIYNKFITIDLSQKEVEIPLICYNPISSVLNGLYDKKQKEIVMSQRDTLINIPLFIGDSTSGLTTSQSILLAAASRGSNNGLMKVTTSKAVYYVGKGIILDSNYIPLLLCMVKWELTESYAINSQKNVLYLSSNIFTNNDMLSNLITKKFIPVFINELNIPEIKIKNMDSYIKHPVEPKLEDIMGSTINDFITKNAVEITEDVFM